MKGKLILGGLLVAGLAACYVSSQVPMPRSQARR